MKRFRIRPMRYATGERYWIGGPDAGRTGAMKVFAVKLDCGETIDKILTGKQPRKTTGQVRPSYPEH